jgi:CRISPR/Cas system-associated exonuclease Cas4 (RecB family)
MTRTCQHITDGVLCNKPARVIDADRGYFCSEHGWTSDAPREHRLGLRQVVLDSISSRRQAPRLRLSQTGMTCAREVYYRATGAPCEPTRDEGTTKMAIGSAFDAYSLPAQKYLGDGVMFHSQVRCEIRVGDVSVWGSADAVFYKVEAAGDWFTMTPLLVSDLKTVSTSTWERTENEPKQEHRAQVNIYAAAIGAPRCSVLYVHTDSGASREHFRDTDLFAARRDFGLFEEVTYWMKRGEPPPRPYDDIEEEDGTVKLARNGFPCSFCAYRATCWPVAERTKSNESVQAA